MRISKIVPNTDEPQRLRSLLHIKALVVFIVFFPTKNLFAEEIVSVPSRENVTQSYLLSEQAGKKPAAIAVLLPGGEGDIRLRMESGRIQFRGGNFLVRSRQSFVNRGITTAVVDTPSDRHGMDDNFRLSAKHSVDIAAITDNLKTRFPDVPIYLVGTSRGTISAASVARFLGNQISGTVLTSSLFLANRGEQGLSGFNYSAIQVPILLVHHRNDGCFVTPYSAATRLSDRYPLISVKGGKPATSEECEAFSAHGYLGKEDETVDAIVKWMLKQPFPREVE